MTRLDFIKKLTLGSFFAAMLPIKSWQGSARELEMKTMTSVGFKPQNVYDVYGDGSVMSFELGPPEPPDIVHIAYVDPTQWVGSS